MTWQLTLLLLACLVQMLRMELREDLVLRCELLPPVLVLLLLTRKLSEDLVWCLCSALLGCLVLVRMLPTLTILMWLVVCLFLEQESLLAHELLTTRC